LFTHADDWSGPEGLDATSVAEIIASHSATTNEIKQLCADLLVLGRADFKLLLKWRLMIKKDIQAKAKAAKPQADDNEKEDPSHQPTPEEALQSKEEQLLIEMAEIKDRLDKRKKRERRKRIESKTKARLRAAQLAQGEGLVEDDATVGLFSLAGVSSLKDKSLEANDADDLMVESEEEGQEIEPEESEELDSEEERSRYDAAMDEYLEDSYRSWKIRQRMKNALGTEPSKKRKRLDTTGELDGEEEEEEEDGSGGDDDEQGESEEDDDESEDGGKFETDPKATSRQVRATGDQGTTDLWFAQDVFDDENIDEDEDEEEMTTKRLEKGKQINLTTNGTSPVSPPHPPLEVSALEDQGFEEVPLAGSDSEDSDSDDPNEFDDLDEDAKAEVLALAKKFIRKKSKDELIEAAYNRYAFHDQGLPKWFEEDERKFMRPAPQVTAEEIKTAKDQLRAIDARPIKKVAEAKARKRKRLQAKLAQARQKAEAIANQEDVPMKAKMREIEKLYAQAKSGKSTKGKKKSKGGRNDQYKKKGPPLDARMRKDRRGQDAATRRLKAKGRKMKSGGKARGRR
jgi:AdoMet-dependent rRNA methyltransferase SPB1